MHIFSQSSKLMGGVNSSVCLEQFITIGGFLKFPTSGSIIGIYSSASDEEIHTWPVDELYATCSIGTVFPVERHAILICYSFCAPGTTSSKEQFCIGVIEVISAISNKWCIEGNGNLLVFGLSFKPDCAGGQSQGIDSSIFELHVGECSCQLVPV